MTNKELLDSISQKMKKLYNERELKLEEVKKFEYSDWLKRQKRKEIMDNFYAKMDKFKELPWYDAAIKSARHEWSLRWKLKKAEKQRDALQKQYEQAQIAHRWQVEFTEEIEIPQKLKDFREKWKKNIDLDEDIKEKIIDAVNKIQKWAREEPDWSIWVKFELWWKAYKTLDVNVAKHSDEEYLASYKYKWQKKNEVKLWWMIWDKTSNRKNKKLKEYVQAKEREWFVIKKIEEMKKLLDKLWAAAGLKDESDKIAMWMYLTWNYWYYWCTMWNHEKSNPAGGSRSLLGCGGSSRYFAYDFIDRSIASLYMIACE